MPCRARRDAMLTLTSSPLPHHLLCMAGAEETKAKPPPLIYSTPFAIKHGTHAAHEHQPPRSRTRSVASPAMDMELLLVLLFLLFLALPVLPAPVRLELARVDANLTGHDLIRRAVQRSLDRPGVVVPRPGGGGGAATAADGGRRSSSAAAASAPVVAGGGEYLVKLGIGTPQHFFSAAIDTATDLVWMQCQPCVSCYRQLDPVFNPRLSSSYAVVPCSSDTCVQFDEHRHVPHCVACKWAEQLTLACSLTNTFDSSGCARALQVPLRGRRRVPVHVQVQRERRDQGHPGHRQAGRRQ